MNPEFTTIRDRVLASAHGEQLDPSEQEQVVALVYREMVSRDPGEPSRALGGPLFAKLVRESAAQVISQRTGPGIELIAQDVGALEAESIRAIAEGHVEARKVELDAASRVRLGVFKLPPKLAQVYFLSTTGMSFADIGRKLGFSKTTASNMFHEAKRQLREMWKAGVLGLLSALGLREYWEGAFVSAISHYKKVMSRLAVVGIAIVIAGDAGSMNPVGPTAAAALPPRTAQTLQAPTQGEMNRSRALVPEIRPVPTHVPLDRMARTTEPTDSWISSVNHLLMPSYDEQEIAVEVTDTQGSDPKFRFLAQPTGVSGPPGRGRHAYSLQAFVLPHPAIAHLDVLGARVTSNTCVQLPHVEAENAYLHNPGLEVGIHVRFEQEICEPCAVGIELDFAGRGPGGHWMRVVGQGLKYSFAGKFLPWSRGSTCSKIQQ